MFVAIAQQHSDRLTDRLWAWWDEISVYTLLRWVLATYIIGAGLEVLKLVLR